MDVVTNVKKTVLLIGINSVLPPMFKNSKHFSTYAATYKLMLNQDYLIETN